MTPDSPSKPECPPHLPEPIPPLPDADMIAAAAKRRREVRARLDQLLDNQKMSRERANDHLTVCLSSLPRSADYDRDPVIPPDRRPAVADALLALWVGFRAERIDIARLIAQIEKQDSLAGEDNLRYVVHLARLGRDNDRQGILDLLAELDKLPGRPDPAVSGEASQEGVWYAFGVQLRGPLHWFNADPYLPDGEEVSRLGNELNPPPSPAQLLQVPETAATPTTPKDTEATVVPGITPSPADDLDDHQHAAEFLKVLDAWLALRKEHRERLHLQAGTQWSDGTTERARSILAGLERHGRVAARFVAQQLGHSESGLVLWWAQAQLADDYSLDNASAGRFDQVRLFVDNAILQVEVAGANERKFMELAIEEARRSVGEDGRAHPKVGAVVVKDGRLLASAHRGELGEGEHAEYTALERKLSTAVVAGATVYTTLEPCTTRNHPKIPCARRLIERKVKRVVIGMLDPNSDIGSKGERLLRDHGIVVDRFSDDLIVQLEELNRDFTRAQLHAAEGGLTH